MKPLLRALLNSKQPVYINAKSRIEWRPKLLVWDSFRFCDSSAARWDKPALYYTTPKLRTDDFFEACCFALSPLPRPLGAPRAKP